MADDLANPYALTVAAKNAQWADTFDAGTTNLAQRRRHAEDIADYEQREAAVEDAAYQQAVMTNKTVQDFHFGRMKAGMEREAHNFKMQTEAKLAPLKLLKEAQDIKTAAALEKERLTSEMHANRRVEEEALDTANFVAQVVPFKRRTPEYFDALFRARLNNPSMKSALFDDMIKDADPTITPEQVLTRLQELQVKAGEKMAVSGDTSGKFSFSQKPQVEKPADLGTERTEYDAEGKTTGKTVTKPVAAPVRRPGDKAVKNGITYIRGEDGKWNPQ